MWMAIQKCAEIFNGEEEERKEEVS